MSGKPPPLIGKSPSRSRRRLSRIAIIIRRIITIRIFSPRSGIRIVRSWEWGREERRVIEGGGGTDNGWGRWARRKN